MGRGKGAARTKRIADNVGEQNELTMQFMQEVMTLRCTRLSFGSRAAGAKLPELCSVLATNSYNSGTSSSSAHPAVWWPCPCVVVHRMAVLWPLDWSLSKVSPPRKADSTSLHN